MNIRARSFRRVICEDYLAPTESGVVSIVTWHQFQALQVHARCAETRHRTSRRIREFCSGVEVVETDDCCGWLACLWASYAAGTREIYISPVKRLDAAKKIKKLNGDQCDHRLIQSFFLRMKSTSPSSATTGIAMVVNSGIRSTSTVTACKPTTEPVAFLNSI